MIRGRIVAAVAASLALLVLAGCTTTDDRPAGITERQRAAATAAELQEDWEHAVGPTMPTPAPKVARIRYTDYRDQPQVLQSCLLRAGYPGASIAPSLEVIDSSLPKGQEQAFQIARYVCQAQFPLDPLELGYLSDSQESYLYQYWGDETVPCLRSEGLQVGNLPPIGQYGEGYEDVGEMNPYAHLDLPAGRSLAAIEARCPPWPGELYPSAASRG